jgi:thioredoxin reductase (NADPH)
MAAQTDYEVAVIGGGPAGLSAALYLARFDRHAALFDAGWGRSSGQQTAHNYLGFPGGRESAPPARIGLPPA